jgi:hypothetical protein
MLKNITFSADPELIEKARKRAEERGTTLNAEVRRWLEQFVSQSSNESELKQGLKRKDTIMFERGFSRDEMNER